MATSSASLSSMILTVSFEGNRLTLSIPKSIKVYEVVQKAAEAFKVKPEGLGFLYQGLTVPEELSVEEALAKAGSVTVIHLIRATKGATTAQMMAADGKPKAFVPLGPDLVGQVYMESPPGYTINDIHDHPGAKQLEAELEFVPILMQDLPKLGLDLSSGTSHTIKNLNAFCKDCEGFVPARVIFQCPNCKEEDKFQRSSGEVIDHFSGGISSEALKGSCTKCCKDGVQAIVIYCCKICDNKPVALLRQIRDNVYSVPCMVCTLKKEKMFKFTCTSQHCMCLDCFGNFCKQQLMVGRFQQFADMDLGYSIACPGPGEDCKRAAIPDPHHFRGVDGDGVFYKKFTDMSFEEFQPTGDQVLCKCRHVIDMSRGKPVQVEPAPQVTVSGLRWYQRLFRTQPKNSPPPKPKTRRRASCTNCKVDHCLECKQLWHDGECQKATKELEEQDKAFPIDPAKAREACWPPGK